MAVLQGHVREHIRRNCEMSHPLEPSNHRNQFSSDLGSFCIRFVRKILVIVSALPSWRVSGRADRSRADRTSDRAGAAQE